MVLIKSHKTAGCLQFCCKPKKAAEKKRVVKYRRRQSSAEIAPLLAIVLMLFLVSVSGRIRETRVLKAVEEECFVDSGGLVTCQFNSVSTFELRPNQQNLVMLLQDHASRSIGTLSVELEKVKSRCKKRTITFTRNAEFKSFSEKRCLFFGSCGKKFCAEMQPNQRIPELALVENYTGYSYCLQNCNGINCGCPPFTPACVFFRIYATPIDEESYELFDCVEWEDFVEAAVTLNYGNSTTNQSIMLYPGLTTEWDQLTITPHLVKQTNTFISDQFLAGGDSKIAILPSSEGILLRCESAQNATDFKCKFPSTACRCNPVGISVSCTCQDGMGPGSYLKEPHLLPRRQGSAWIMPTPLGPVAEPPVEFLTLTISLKGLELRSQVDASHCHLFLSPITGCYDCETGATFNATCITDFGVAIAMVECGDQTFALHCSESPGKIEPITLILNEPTINLNCSAYCPASTVFAQLMGNLDQPQLFNLHNTHKIHTLGNSNDTSWDFRSLLAGTYALAKDATGIVWRILQIHPIFLLAFVPLIISCFPAQIFRIIFSFIFKKLR